MKTLIVSIVIGMLALAGAAPVAAQLKDDEATSVGATPPMIQQPNGTVTRILRRVRCGCGRKSCTTLTPGWTPALQ
jgi:hypothetical protein